MKLSLDRSTELLLTDKDLDFNQIAIEKDIKDEDIIKMYSDKA